MEGSKRPKKAPQDQAPQTYARLDDEIIDWLVPVADELFPLLPSPRRDEPKHTDAEHAQPITGLSQPRQTLTYKTNIAALNAQLQSLKEGVPEGCINMTRPEVGDIFLRIHIDDSLTVFMSRIPLQKKEVALLWVIKYEEKWHDMYDIKFAAFVAQGKGKGVSSEFEQRRFSHGGYYFFHVGSRKSDYFYIGMSLNAPSSAARVFFERRVGSCGRNADDNYLLTGYEIIRDDELHVMVLPVFPARSDKGKKFHVTPDLYSERSSSLQKALGTAYPDAGEARLSQWEQQLRNSGIRADVDIQYLHEHDFSRLLLSISDLVLATALRKLRKP